MTENRTPYEKRDARRQEMTEEGRATRPANVREPQDHKPKLKSTRNMGPQDIEFRGRFYVIDPRVLDDWELLEQVQEAGDDGNMLMIKSLLGDEYDRVKEDIREDEGYVSTEVFTEFFGHVNDFLQNLR